MIADPFKDGFDEITGDNETIDYQLTHRPVKEGSVEVSVNNDVQELDNDYTIELEEGILHFDATPANEVLIEVKYKYSTFSDEELTEFLALDGTVKKATIRCIEILLADAARMFDYTAGLTDIKASQVFNNLSKLLDRLKAEVASGNSTVTIMDRSSHHYGHEAGEGDFIGAESRQTVGDLSKDDL